jgi:hypothetical protein
VVALWRCWSGAENRVVPGETPALFIWGLGNWRRPAARQLSQLEFRDLGTVAVVGDGAGRPRAARISLGLKLAQTLPMGIAVRLLAGPSWWEL